MSDNKKEIQKDWMMKKHETMDVLTKSLKIILVDTKAKWNDFYLIQKCAWGRFKAYQCCQVW